MMRTRSRKMRMTRIGMRRMVMRMIKLMVMLVSRMKTMRLY